MKKGQRESQRQGTNRELFAQTTDLLVLMPSDRTDIKRNKNIQEERKLEVAKEKDSMSLKAVEVVDNTELTPRLRE